MNRLGSTIIAALLSVAALGAAACTTYQRAVPYASLRSGCPEDKIKLVRESGHDIVLDVCGVYEDWRWNAINGYEYVGRSAVQPVRPPADADRDGVPDVHDACPALAGAPSPEPTKNGCPAPPPPPDADRDGVPDGQDACPQVAGAANPVPKRNGCPPVGDKDKDGVLDDEDACPEIAGIASAEAAQSGCPGDADGDGIRDDRDACPGEKGIESPEPAKSGCPRAQLKDDQIALNEPVVFEADNAVVKPESEALLDAVAQLLKDHPELKKLEVQGYTDNEGKAAANKQASQRRARAVMDALVKRGVEGKRLAAKGYGPEKPIADNATPEGRAKNLRIDERARRPGPQRTPVREDPGRGRKPRSRPTRRAVVAGTEMP
ncbi:MAG: OmpA family protein [Deltaproteobacteria bacterium]|nr:OmpA family protein [Deltaproteobacteria bacterium]